MSDNMDYLPSWVRQMVADKKEATPVPKHIITDMGDNQVLVEVETGKEMTLDRYAVWSVEGGYAKDVIETGNDPEVLKKKYNLTEVFKVKRNEEGEVKKAEVKEGKQDLPIEWKGMKLPNAPAVHGIRYLTMDLTNQSILDNIGVGGFTVKEWSEDDGYIIHITFDTLELDGRIGGNDIVKFEKYFNECPYFASVYNDTVYFKLELKEYIELDNIRTENDK